MDANGKFADFDNEQIFKQSEELALNELTLNFVVEFGRGEAQIAFDLQTDDIKKLLDERAPAKRPIKWMCVVSCCSSSVC